MSSPVIADSTNSNGLIYTMTVATVLQTPNQTCAILSIDNHAHAMALYGKPVLAAVKAAPALVDPN